MAKSIRVVFEGSASDLERAAADAGIALKAFGMASSSTRRKFSEWESHIPIVGGMLDGFNRGVLNTTGSIFKMIPGLEGFGQSFQNIAPMLAPFLSWLEFIPGLAFAALFAVNALADMVGVLTAFLADLVAPAALIVGLLGALGVGFGLAAKKAFGGGGALGDAVKALRKQFDGLITTLEGRFMPIFRFLAQTASDALTYLTKIAKLPLDQAFRSLATKGVQAVSNFLGQVGHLLAHPIRLAFQIAFGSGKGGNEVASAVAGLWHQFVDFWTGYTKTQRVQFGAHVIVTQTQVAGALQPFLDWFNRHDFTSQGFKIGHTLMKGLAKISGPLSTLIVQILADAAKKAARAMLDALLPWSSGTKARTRALNDWITRELEAGARVAWNKAKQLAGQAWGWVQARAGGVIGSITASIRGHLSSAWNAVRGIAGRVWSYIRGLFSQLLSVHISWPSPPGWVNSILGAGGSLLHKIPGTASGGIVTSPQVRLVGEAGPEAIIPLSRGGFVRGGGAGTVIVNIYPRAVLSTKRDLAVAVQQGMRELGRRGGSVIPDVLERRPLVSRS